MRDAILGVILLLSSVQPTFGCEISALKLRRVPSDVTVAVTHRDNPMAGIAISVIPEKSSKAVFMGMTDRLGIVHIRRLAAGHYYVSASHAGIEAGKESIEVVDVPDAKTENASTFNGRIGRMKVRVLRGRSQGLFREVRETS